MCVRLFLCFRAKRWDLLFAADGDTIEIQVLLLRGIVCAGGAI